jgi:hypothetical protein
LDRWASWDDYEDTGFGDLIADPGAVTAFGEDLWVSGLRDKLERRNNMTGDALELAVEVLRKNREFGDYAADLGNRFLGPAWQRLAESTPEGRDTARRLLEAEASFGDTSKLLFGLPPDEVDPPPMDPNLALLDALNRIASGGGGSAPQYVAPDRRVVKDTARGMLQGLIGSQWTEGQLEAYTDLYMNDHRRDWDVRERDIDPAQSVLEMIRGTDQYKNIHRLRPNGVDETQWLTTYQQAATRYGFANDLADSFAEEQATVGGQVGRLGDAAAVEQYNLRGQKRPELFDKFGAAATSMTRRVR